MLYRLMANLGEVLLLGLGACAMALAACSAL